MGTGKENLGTISYEDKDYIVKKMDDIRQTLDLHNYQNGMPTKVALAIGALGTISPVSSVASMIAIFFGMSCIAKGGADLMQAEEFGEMRHGVGKYITDPMIMSTSVPEFKKALSGLPNANKAGVPVINKQLTAIQAGAKQMTQQNRLTSLAQFGTGVAAVVGALACPAAAPVILTAGLTTISAQSVVKNISRLYHGEKLNAVFDKTATQLKIVQDKYDVDFSKPSKMPALNY